MDEFAELAFLLEQEQEQRQYNKLAYLYPETGPLRRELYARTQRVLADLRSRVAKLNGTILEHRPLILVNTRVNLN